MIASCFPSGFRGTTIAGDGVVVSWFHRGWRDSGASRGRHGSSLATHAAVKREPEMRDLLRAIAAEQDRLVLLNDMTGERGRCP
jgi:hypothetical protein